MFNELNSVQLSEFCSPNAKHSYTVAQLLECKTSDDNSVSRVYNNKLHIV